LLTHAILWAIRISPDFLLFLSVQSLLNVGHGLCSVSSSDVAGVIGYPLVLLANKAWRELHPVLELRYSSFHCSVVKRYDSLSELKTFYWFTEPKTLFWMVTERLIDVWRDSECRMLYKTEIVKQIHGIF
jgi:hypothetical protein